MSRKRIHELAKDLNLSSKDLIAMADAIGMTNKRSQSSLTEDEEERLNKAAAGWQNKPSVTVGDEKVVTGTTGQTLVERRVTTNVIRRRRSQSDGPEGAAGGPPMEPLPLPPTETFHSFAAPEALAVSIPTHPPDMPEASA